MVEGGLVRRLAARCEAVLGELAAMAGDGRAGGRTPSDLPLAALDQAELDRIEAAVPELVDVLPLTPLQEGLAFHAAARAPGEPDPYVVQHTLGLAGPVDAGRLRAAAAALLDRHPHLRARFWQTEDGRVLQVVPAGGGVAWRDVDLGGLAPDEQARRIALVAADERDRGIDLAAGPPVRFALLRLDGEFRLVLTCHHVVADGWSAPLILPRPAGAAHRGRGGRRPAAGTPLPRPPRLAGDPRRRRRP